MDTLFGTSLIFYINTQRHVLHSGNFNPTQSLAQYIRSDRVGLKGTKICCNEGGCGACTVMVSNYDFGRKCILRRPANSCMLPLYSLDGKQVVTIEGIGSAKYPHPIQERIALLHGTQCGYCTPGFSMSLYVLLCCNPNPTDKDIEDCFDGNLCRCTGYRSILSAGKTFSKKECCKAAQNTTSGKGCSERAGCCKDKKNICRNMCDSNSQTSRVGQDPIFPPFLLRYMNCTADLGIELSLKMLRLDINSNEPCAHLQVKSVFRPLNMEDLLSLRSKYPDASLVAGNNLVGLVSKNHPERYGQSLIYIGDMADLKQVHISDDKSCVTFGAGITLADMSEQSNALISQIDSTTSTLPLVAIRDSISNISSPQIRSFATLGGHIVGALPTSDLNPIFIACAAMLVFRSKTGYRTISIREAFSSFGCKASEPIVYSDEVLIKVKLFLPSSTERVYIRYYRHSMRKANDAPVVACAMYLKLNLHNDMVSDACFSFSGIGKTTIIADKANSKIICKKWNDSMLLDRFLLNAVAEDIAYQLIDRDGKSKYRISLVLGYLSQFWHMSQYHFGFVNNTYSQLDNDMCILVDSSAAPNNPISDISLANINRIVPIGEGIPHMSSLEHTTGEARYTNDIQPISGELHVALVQSTHSHARILSINAEDALSIPNIYPKLFTYNEIPGSNFWNYNKDQEIFASDVVHFHGQVIAAVVSSDRELAKHAAKLVKIEYEDLPAIYTIDQAIKHNSFLGPKLEVECGDFKEAASNAAHIFTGEARCGAQEHFYLEPHCVIVVPKGEQNEYDVYITTQHQMLCQSTISSALGIPINRITCHTKRIGAGFGGKDTVISQLSSITAICAQDTGKPVRLLLDRDVDMQITGQRHPYLGKWTVAVDSSHKITGYKAELYSNGGYSYDCSTVVMTVCLSSIDGCYKIPNSQFSGRICKTNISSSTSFRGLGSCQAGYITESMMSEVSERLGIDAIEFRMLNMYKEGDTNPSGYVIKDWTVPLMVNKLIDKAEYKNRALAIRKFNKESINRKRGIALVPTKHGISFGQWHLCEAAALVHIYLDGTVLISHCGIEIGQGLHTKMAMIAAHTLDIPLVDVFISGTSTNTIANATPTGSSMSTDLNGAAVERACKILAKRLEPYRKKQLSDNQFKDAVMDAYHNQVDLSARGFFRARISTEDLINKRGMEYFYYTQGVAIAEVELDILSGGFDVTSVEILMDIGKPINRALDIGQIEGAFVQGMGWATSEEWLLDSNTGSLITKYPMSYKVPTAKDIPQIFSVDILEGYNYKHLDSIHSSKAVGEPPLFLGVSVFFALREAVKAARIQTGSSSGKYNESIHIDIPATTETLRMSCEDKLTELSETVTGSIQARGKGSAVIRT